MKRKMFAVCTLTVLMPLLSFAQSKEPLKQVATIPLPGLKDGDFDHFTPDVDGHRLFLTDEENNKVDILDTNANKRDSHHRRGQSATRHFVPQGFEEIIRSGGRRFRGKDLR